MANIIFPYTMENVLLVPQSATVDIQDKKFVYVLQPDSTVKYTEIQISNLNDGKNYIVLDGLKSGDKIAVEGVTRLTRRYEDNSDYPCPKRSQVSSRL